MIILALTNPGADAAFEQLSIDYGHIHSGMTLNSQQLKEMGTYTYSNYIIFSTLDYQFGDIGVSYFGIGGRIFFRGSYKREEYQRS